MGITDKVDDKFDQAKGKTREQYGKATGNEEQEGKGKMEQAKGKAGETVEDVKDKVGDLKDKITN